MIVPGIERKARVTQYWKDLLPLLFGSRLTRVQNAQVVPHNNTKVDDSSGWHVVMYFILRQGKR
jgi:hypothetical protein